MSTAVSFFGKIIANDAARKGVAAAIAGVLVAVVQEALLGGQPST